MLGGAGGGACAVTRAGGRGRAAGACAGAGAGAANLDIGGLRWLKTSAGRVRAVGAKAKVGAGAGAGAVHVDIGARARARQTQRMWTLVIGGGAVAGLAIFAMNSLWKSSQRTRHQLHPSLILIFLIPRPCSPPLQALEKFAENSSANRFRLGGLVKEGSVRIPAGSIEMEFVVTDLATDILIPVCYRGALTDLFRKGHSVVAEGFLRSLSHADTAAFLDAPPHGCPARSVQGGPICGGGGGVSAAAQPSHHPCFLGCATSPFFFLPPFLTPDFGPIQGCPARSVQGGPLCGGGGGVSAAAQPSHHPCFLGCATSPFFFLPPFLTPDFGPVQGCPARSVQGGPFSGGGGLSAASQPSHHRCFLHCHTSSHLPFSPQPTPPPLHQILVRFRGALPDLFREGHSVVAEGFLRPLSEANTSAFTGSSIATASSSSGFSGRGATVLGVAEAEGAVVERGIGEGGARGEGGGVGEKGVGEWEEGEDVSASARSVGYFFAATEVLAKHDEKHMPKEVAAALEKNLWDKYMPKEVAAALEKNRAAIEAAGEGDDTSDALRPALEKNRAAIEAAGEGDDTSDGEGEGKDDGERSVGEAQKGKKSSVGSGGGAAGSAALGMGDGAKKPGKLSKLGQSPSVAQGYDIPS
ncbi:unnamed protein product [Closterium sp. Naga37s-1]|nr:unnamed protein product [Closterium sp. Naga37s-1]